MTTTVWFDVVDRLIDVFTDTLTNVTVLDHTGITDDPGDYLMVGIDDPDSDSPSSGEFQQEWTSVPGRHRSEDGTVTCAAMTWNGDSNLRVARADAKAMLAAIENNLRTDPNLGAAVPGLMWTSFGTRGKPTQILGETGAVVIVSFDIAYKARIGAP